MSSKRMIPKNHRSIARRYPLFMAALDALGEAAASAGPLTAKTRHLVQIGAAAAIRSEGAVHSHTRRALAAGSRAAGPHWCGYGVIQPPGSQPSDRHQAAHG